MRIHSSILSHVCNDFYYEIGGERLVLFAIRGCLPDDALVGKPSEAAKWKPSHRVRQARLNFRSSRCTIGIWDRGLNQLTIFPGSTVPSQKYLFDHQSALQHFNMLNPGKYEYVRGMHPRENTGFQRHEAFLMDGFGHVTVPGVSITKKRLRFDFSTQKEYILRPGDNLHASRTEPGLVENRALNALKMPFSSSGCITIVGQPAEYLIRPPNGEWNSWTSFCSVLNERSAGMAHFSFLLFDFRDFESISDHNSLREIRYGASGIYVRNAQRILSSVTTYNTSTPYYTGILDGRFEEETFSSFLSFQRDFYAPGTKKRPDLLQFLRSTRHFITQY